MITGSIVGMDDGSFLCVDVEDIPTILLTGSAACMDDDVEDGRLVSMMKNHKPFLMSNANNHCVCLVEGGMAPLRQEQMLLAHISISL